MPTPNDRQAFRAVPLLATMLYTGEQSFADLRARVSNIHYVADGVAFKFDDVAYHMPEPYPEVLYGAEHTDAAKRLCVRAMLDRTASVTPVTDTRNRSA